MAGRLRKLFESLAYAGLKPTPHGVADDPLYLTHRTWRQKMRVWLLVAVPVVLVAGSVFYALLTPPGVRDNVRPQASPAEVAARTAILPKDFTVTQNNDLQVTEAAVEKSGSASYVAGTVRNNTGRTIAGADLAFELTDDSGSHVGAASGKSQAIAPNGSARFRIPISQQNATFVLVREVRPSL